MDAVEVSKVAAEDPIQSPAEYHVILGARLVLPTVFGRVAFTVKKVTSSEAELESRGLVTFLDKRNGRWEYDGCVINKQAISKVQFV